MIKDRQSKIAKLKKYFEKREDVVMAFLFGSQAKERAHSGSDWDIAVYFKPEVEKVEWEEHGREYPEEDRVWSDCADILKTDNVDFIVLNRATASIADAAIRGIPLVVKDWGTWLRFMLIITRQAEDYRQFVDEFYAISQRSASLTPQDREDLKRTLDFLDSELESYATFKVMTGQEYETNIDQRRNVERWAENIVNAAIDTAKIILGSNKKLIPESYRVTLQRSVWALNLPEDFIEKFEKWVKLRNVLAHEYLDIKWKRINDFIQNSEPYFKKFIEAAKNFLETSR